MDLTTLLVSVPMDLSMDCENRDKGKHRENINLISDADCVLKRCKAEFKKRRPELDVQVTRKRPQVSMSQHILQKAHPSSTKRTLNDSDVADT